MPIPTPLEHRHYRFPVLQLVLSSLLITILLPVSTIAFETTIIVTITATATATATATTTNPQIPQDRSYTSVSQFKSSVLSTTNAYRTTHNASNLVWNEKLASFANQWAKTCLWEHSVRILPASHLYI